MENKLTPERKRELLLEVKRAFEADETGSDIARVILELHGAGLGIDDIFEQMMLLDN
ncbi:MAG: hypothetical protein WC505_05625 [Patescibacteria group bacterium]